jgi:predicted DNA-binding transcriptional regulator AlpA
MGRPTNPQEGSAEQLLRCEQVAALLNLTEVTLAEWRRLGKGPTYVRFGLRCVRYRARDVESWIASQEVQPTRLVAPPQAGLGQYLDRARALRPAPMETAKPSEHSRRGESS